MSSADPQIRDRLARAADPMSFDVDERLEAVHRQSRIRQRNRRATTALLGMAIAVAGVTAAWVLLRLAPDEDPASTTQQPGRIALTAIDFSDEEAAYRIFVAEGDGSELIPFTPGGTPGYLPMWSPDGEHVAFIEGPGDFGRAIVVANADGSEPRTVVTGEDSIFSMSWSPDGGQIAYTAGDGPNGALWMVNVDGTGTRRVLGGEWRNVAWSPTGDELVLAGYPGGDYESTDLYLVGSDGTGLVRLVGGAEDEDFPVWSPDGSRIAFVRHEANYDDVGYRSDVYVANADGSGVSRLTEWKGFDGFPAWSPDGRQIAFASDRLSPGKGFGDGFVASLFVMNADGSEARELIAPSQGVRILAPSSWAG